MRLTKGHLKLGIYSPFKKRLDIWSKDYLLDEFDSLLCSDFSIIYDYSFLQIILSYHLKTNLLSVYEKINDKTKAKYN